MPLQLGKLLPLRLLALPSPGAPDAASDAALGAAAEVAHADILGAEFGRGADLRVSPAPLATAVGRAPHSQGTFLPRRRFGIMSSDMSVSLLACVFRRHAVTAAAIWVKAQLPRS
jgi:hypothetical protein